MPRDTLFAPRIPRWTGAVVALTAVAVAAIGAQVVRSRDAANVAVAPAVTSLVVPSEPDAATPPVEVPTAPSAVVAAPGSSPAVTPSVAARRAAAAAVAAAIPNPVSVVVTPPTTGSSTPPATPVARTQPTVGSYPATITGSAKLNGNPQQVGPTGTLDIAQLTGTDQHQSTEGGPADLDLTLRYDAGSAKLVTLVLAAGGITKTVKPTAPVQFLPFAGPQGTRWTWRATSTDGKTTIDAVGTVTGSDVLTIDGRSVPVTVVDYVMTPSGDVTGTVHLTSWVSSAYRLVVKQHHVIDAKATAYGFTVPFTCDTTTTLTDLDPA